MQGFAQRLKRLKWQARVTLKRTYRNVDYRRLSVKGLPIVFGNSMAKILTILETYGLPIRMDR